MVVGSDRTRRCVRLEGRDVDLTLLRTFVTVHRAGSFTRAAALLGLSQPAVTSQIRTLERQLAARCSFARPAE